LHCHQLFLGSIPRCRCSSSHHGLCLGQWSLMVCHHSSVSNQTCLACSGAIYHNMAGRSLRSCRIQKLASSSSHHPQSKFPSRCWLCENTWSLLGKSWVLHLSGSSPSKCFAKQNAQFQHRLVNSRIGFYTLPNSSDQAQKGGHDEGTVFPR